METKEFLKTHAIPTRFSNETEAKDFLHFLHFESEREYSDICNEQLHNEGVGVGPFDYNGLWSLYDSDLDVLTQAVIKSTVIGDRNTQQRIFVVWQWNAEGK